MLWDVYGKSGFYKVAIKSVPVAINNLEGDKEAAFR